MKKALVIAFLFVCVCFLAAAGVSFKALSTQMYYKPYTADPWSFQTRAQYISLLNNKALNEMLVFSRAEEGRQQYYINVDSIKADGKEDFVYEIAPFRDAEDGISSFLRLKPAFSIGLLNVEYNKDVKTQAVIQAGVNLFIEASGNTDVVGFDGIYFVGFNADIKDKVFFKIGAHHYSGHYSDEVTDSLLTRGDSEGRLFADRMMYDYADPGYIARTMGYVRQDSLICALSVCPVKGLRCYFEADIVPGMLNFRRPWVFVSENTAKMNRDDCTLEQYIGKTDGAYESISESRVKPYDSSYKDLAFEWGFEYAFDFNKAGILTAALDCKVIQEGQTMFQTGAYDKSNPWDFACDIMVSYDIANSGVSAELNYHYGRLPLLNFCWFNTSYISAGFSVKAK